LSHKTLFWGDFKVQQGEGGIAFIRGLRRWAELRKEVTNLCMRVCSIKEYDGRSGHSTSSQLGREQQYDKGVKSTDASVSSKCIT
jgi:hypothetical protein